MQGNIPGFINRMCDQTQNAGCENEARFHLFGKDMCGECYRKWLQNPYGDVVFPTQFQQDQLSLF